MKDAEIFRKKTDSLLAGDRGGVFIKLKPDIGNRRGWLVGWWVGWPRLGSLVGWLWLDGWGFGLLVCLVELMVWFERFVFGGFVWLGWGFVNH